MLWYSYLYFCVAQEVKQDMFSSTSEMEKLASCEREATENLRKLNDLMEQRIAEVKRLKHKELLLLMETSQR
jgi:hypothetical protein